MSWPLAVVPANVQDCDTLSALNEGKPFWPSLRLGLFDSVFRAKRCEEWCNIHGMRRRVVEKKPDQKGFFVLERRWAVERTFGWLSHWGGLLRDRPPHLRGLHHRRQCPQQSSLSNRAQTGCQVRSIA